MTVAGKISHHTHTPHAIPFAGFGMSIWWLYVCTNCVGCWYLGAGVHSQVFVSGLGIATDAVQRELRELFSDQSGFSELLFRQAKSANKDDFAFAAFETVELADAAVRALQKFKLRSGKEIHLRINGDLAHRGARERGDRGGADRDRSGGEQRPSSRSPSRASCKYFRSQEVCGVCVCVCVCMCVCVCVCV
jgi:hypothetical protein